MNKLSIVEYRYPFLKPHWFSLISSDIFIDLNGHYLSVALLITNQRIQMSIITGLCILFREINISKICHLTWFMVDTVLCMFMSS